MRFRLLLFISIIGYHFGWTQIPKDSLLLYLRFDNSIKDESPKHLNIINHGAELSFDRFNNPKSALHFNGSDQYFSIKDTLAFRPKSFTFSGWFSFDSVPVNGATMLTKKLGVGDTNVFNLFFKNNTLEAYIGNKTGNGLSSVSSFIPEKNSWFHTALVFDSIHQTQKLFINGILVDTLSNTKKLVWDNNSILFGVDKTNNKDTTFFAGSMDDIRFYNRELTPKEINFLTFEKDTITIKQGGWSPRITSVYHGKDQIKVEDLFSVRVIETKFYYCPDSIEITFNNFEEVKGMSLNILFSYNFWEEDITKIDFKEIINITTPRIKIKFFKNNSSYGTYKISITDNKNKTYKGSIQKVFLVPAV